MHGYDITKSKDERFGEIWHIKMNLNEGAVPKC